MSPGAAVWAPEGPSSHDARTAELSGVRSAVSPAVVPRRGPRESRGSVQRREPGGSGTAASGQGLGLRVPNSGR